MTYLEVLGRSALIPLSFHKTSPTIYHAQLCHPPIYPLDLGHLLSLFMFLNSNTDNMSQNAKIFSLPFWTLREWWASGCSTQPILASADYELERDPDLWSALQHCSSRLLLCCLPLVLDGHLLHLFKIHLTSFWGWYPYIWENAANNLIIVTIQNNLFNKRLLNKTG